MLTAHRTAAATWQLSPGRPRVRGLGGFWDELFKTTPSVVAPGIMPDTSVPVPGNQMPTSVMPNYPSSARFLMVPPVNMPAGPTPNMSLNIGPTSQETPPATGAYMSTGQQFAPDAGAPANWYNNKWVWIGGGAGALGLGVLLWAALKR